MTKPKKKKAKDKDIVQTMNEDIMGNDTTLEVINIADEAILLAKKFIQKAYSYKERLYQDPTLVYIGCKESGALKRISMDLTRVLAKVRNPNKQ